MANQGLRGKRGISDCRADIVHAVASIPDSLDIWFYGKKCDEEGRRVGVQSK
jgi:hypothetical protein